MSFFDRHQRAVMLGCVPVVLAMAFTALAPSEGANIGGGILTLLAIPVGLLIYLAVRPRGADRRPLRHPRDW
jgi:hypothetical protein